MDDVLVHPVYSHTTDTWQYVVASSSTRHCIVLDPVRDRLQDKARVETEAADALVFLTRQYGYIADLILETHSSRITCLSAAWAVRMQLSTTQEEAPKLCTDAGIPGLDAMWQRKYGTGMSTTIKPALCNGEQVHTNGLSVTCVRIPSPGTQDQYAYHIGDNLFGAHNLLASPEFCRRNNVTPSSTAVDDPTNIPKTVWESLQRLATLPSDTKVWYTEARDVRRHESLPCDYLSQCLAVSKIDSLSQIEFMFAWQTLNIKGREGDQTKDQKPKGKRHYLAWKRSSSP